MFAILRMRNFGLLWFGQVISVAGDWVLYASLAFYVYTLTGSVLASGSLMIMSTLPRIVLGTVAGVFVDRWDRRRTMIAADLSRAAVLLPLLAVRSGGDMWIVYLVALADSALGQFFGPAKNALVPTLVRGDELVAANSANAVGDQIGRLVGPAVGGFMLAAFGLRSVVIGDVASFLVSAGLIGLMVAPGRGDLGDHKGRPYEGDHKGRGDEGDHKGRGDEGDHKGRGDEGDRKGRGDEGDRKGRGDLGDLGDHKGRPYEGDHKGRGDEGDLGDHKGRPYEGDHNGRGDPCGRPDEAGVAQVWRELLDGFRLMARSRVVVALFLLWTITSVGEGLLEVLVVPWVSSVLAGTSFTFGWMLTVQAVGSIAGGALLASAGKTRHARRLVVLGALGWGVLDVAIFNARLLPAILTLFALVGIPIAAMVVSFNALIQAETPDAYRGRVFGAFGTAAAVAMLAGMGISSALAGRVGIVTMLNVACAVVVLGTAVGWAKLRRS